MNQVIINKDQNYLIKKNEKLIFARHNLNEHSIKIMLCLISQIKKEDKDFKEYTLTSANFKKLIQSKSNKIIEDMIKASRELLNKTIKIDLGEEILITKMIISYKYKKEEGSYIKYMIHPKLKPYLLNLNKNYLSYNIFNVLGLKGSYSIRLYEFLKHNYNTNKKYTKNPFITIQMQLKDFREQFNIPTSYNLFKIKKIF